MEKAEIKRIADYTREIDEGLDKLDCREITMRVLTSWIAER
ncbi:MAG: hypothetical protein ACYS80_13945 [Planctomycetota bacterium]|jgi:hypothetical protein